MTADRPIRDILAEMMRRERLGLVRPLWAHWCSFDDEGPEQWRLRADHLVRLLASAGCKIERTREHAQPDSGHEHPAVFWRYWMDGNKSERVLRTAGDKIEVVRIVDGAETVQLTFGIGDAHDAGGALLLGDRETAQRQGILTMLSAALEAYRLDVAVMGTAQ